MKILTIPPKYRLSKQIVQYLSEIESNKGVIDNIDIPLEVEKNIRRQSVLGSALFSARIEGNTLTQAEAQSFGDLSRKDQRKVEIANLCRAVEKILDQFSSKEKTITKTDFLAWHKLAMKNILYPDYLGSFRHGQEGLFDTSGNLIYHAPPPTQVEPLVTELLGFVNGKKEKIHPIKAILAHLIFEKIHPFVDGSGRVGCLLQMAILCQGGYAMKGLIVVEEEIDNNRQSYYEAIEQSTGSDSTPFVELMLEFLKDATGKTRDLVLAQKNNPSRFDILSPRRREIAQIIFEQRLLPFDSIRRRFLKVSPRQLAYDLESLIRAGFIIKIGKTRGALYAPKT